jgi:hypothetical protein
MSSVLRAGKGSAAGLNTAFSIASMDLFPTIGRTYGYMEECGRDDFKMLCKQLLNAIFGVGK